METGCRSELSEVAGFSPSQMFTSGHLENTGRRQTILKITCTPIGETDLRAVSRNSGRGRNGVRARDGGLSPC